MKLLLCVEAIGQLEDTLQHFGAVAVKEAAHPYLYAATVLHHEVDILETGYGLFQTTFKMTRTLSLKKYHLALKLSRAIAYKPELSPGTVLNIVNEKPGDTGLLEGGEWKDLYDLNRLQREEYPQVRGGFINLTNAYMNVFLPFKKVVGLTVNTAGNTALTELRREKYKADAETTDGLGFVYPCLFDKQSFYHLGIVEKNLATGEENVNLATQNLNLTLIDLIQKL